MAAFKQFGVAYVSWRLTIIVPRFVQNSMLYASSSHWSMVFQLLVECCKIFALVIGNGK